MFILLWLYLYFTFSVCPFLLRIIDNGSLEDPFYFFLSLFFCFLINFFIFSWKENFNNNKDIFYKFISFLFKPFTWLFTFFLCEFKKLINFFKKFKYKKFFTKIYLLVKSFFSKSSLIWRPIFKKWSYFGFLKTNKFKWFK